MKAWKPSRHFVRDGNIHSFGIEILDRCSGTVTETSYFPLNSTSKHTASLSHNQTVTPSLTAEEWQRTCSKNILVFQGVKFGNPSYMCMFFFSLSHEVRHQSQIQGCGDSHILLLLCAAFPHEDYLHTQGSACCPPVRRSLQWSEGKCLLQTEVSGTKKQTKTKKQQFGLCSLPQLKWDLTGEDTILLLEDTGSQLSFDRQQHLSSKKGFAKQETA